MRMLAQYVKHCMAQNNVYEWVDGFKQLLEMGRLVFNITNIWPPCWSECSD